MQVKYRDFHRQYALIKDELQEAISQVIAEGEFVLGSAVSRFEKEFAAYLAMPFCIGVASGTDALELAIEALGLPAESEIIVPANSFIACSEAVSRTGHKIVFCDCDEQNYTLSPESVKSKITSKTKAIMAVHLYGHPCDMDALLEIAKTYKLRLIEDCSQAHGAEYKGKKVGSFGDIAAFSFNPVKNLGAWGDAGVVVTSDSELAEFCRLKRNHGRINKGNHLFEGRNSRLDTLQAAILSVKLRYLDKWIARRQELALSYEYLLRDVEGVILPKCETWAKPVYHIYNVRFEERHHYLRYFHSYNIGISLHYAHPLPHLKAYSQLEQNCDDFFAVKSNSQFISLPLYETMSDEELVYVAQIIKLAKTEIGKQG